MGNASSMSSAFQTGGSPDAKAVCAKDTTDNGSSQKSSSKLAASSAAMAESATERAKKVFGDVQESLKSSVKKLEDQDHPAAHLIDTVCGPYFDGPSDRKGSRKMRENRSASFYSEDYNSDDSRTISEDEQTLDTDYNASSTVNGSTVASSAIATGKKGHTGPIPTDSSYLSQSDYESSEVGGGRDRNSRDRHSKRDKSKRDKRHRHKSDDDPSSTALSDDDDSKTTETISVAGGGKAGPQQLLAKPLASSFAKRCYFTKSGIGKTTQHYEGLTLTGNVVLMLAAAMKLKGCPTICDEDLRRVEQTYPNQFSRLPDELLLSSGWRRISKYCHFSNKPIPDGIPFFHSKQRLHPQGGYYFLLAAAVGMVRPIDVEPLTRDTLVLLETDYPSQCDAAPEVLIQDPDEWTLVDKFCFFSGGPINTEEDVYYQADFDGNPIYMLAFLSPSLTPDELYKLENITDNEGTPVTIPGLTSVNAVQEVESVYDLTDRDFHDLKLYHLGPCRALPQYILQPQAWTKVLPPHFLEARHKAIMRAHDYELQNGGPVTPLARDPMATPAQQLTVGATPVDGRYDGAPGGSAYQEQHPPYDEHAAAGVPQDQNGYYGQPSPHGTEQHHHPHHQQGPQQPPGYASEYGPPPPHHGYGPDPEQQHPYQQQHGNHPYHDGSPSNQHYAGQQSPQMQTNGSGNDHYFHQLDHDPNGNLQREVEEEGAFVDSQLAPIDEAMNSWKMGPPGTNMMKMGPPGTNMMPMDPPEHLPSDPEIDDSVVASEAMNPNNLSNASYYSQHDEVPLEYSNTPGSQSNYANMRSPARGHHNMDAPVYGTPGSPGDDYSTPAATPKDAPQYSYSNSPGDEQYYQHPDPEQARDDQYYDTPDGLKEDPVGSQDHEFFNAPSGGGEEEDDYEPSHVSSFDPHSQVGGRHPDDYQGAEYYEDEVDSRLDIQDSSSAEYFRAGEDSPSPIKMDHLRRLGRQQQAQQSPQRHGTNPHMMASPTSQASENSVSEYSHSSAMRGAQELLKRNRQRRHEQARRRLNANNNEVPANESLESDVSPDKSAAHYAFAPENGFDGDENFNAGARQRGDDGSASTFGSQENSEAMNSVISGSSVWTDTSNPTDRSSRRALILQMAKARMKSNKERDPAETTIKEEKSHSMDDTDLEDEYGGDMDHPGLTENPTTSGTELDIVADLD